jgi:hypothetical protein
MRTKTLILAVAALPIIGTVASSAPQTIRDKTITAAWSVENTFERPNGSVATAVVNQQRVIYVSSASRIFVKATFNSPRGGQSAEIAPGGTTPAGGARDARIEGGKIIAMAALQGGAAGRMIISFDQSYSTCTVDVTIGRNGGGPLMRRGPGGAPIEIISQRVSGQSCSVREGNAFANQ